jgi:hypothetical protein
MSFGRLVLSTELVEYLSGTGYQAAFLCQRTRNLGNLRSELYNKNPGLRLDFPALTRGSEATLKLGA